MRLKLSRSISATQVGCCKFGPAVIEADSCASKRRRLAMPVSESSNDRRSSSWAWVPQQAQVALAGADVQVGLHHFVAAVQAVGKQRVLRCVQPLLRGIGFATPAVHKRVCTAAEALQYGAYARQARKRRVVVEQAGAQGQPLLQRPCVRQHAVEVPLVEQPTSSTGRAITTPRVPTSATLSASIWSAAYSPTALREPAAMTVVTTILLPSPARK